MQQPKGVGVKYKKRAQMSLETTERREATGIYDQQSLARTFASSVSQSEVSVQTFPPNATWVYIYVYV